MLTLAEAWDAIMGRVQALSSESVPLAEAAGRCLAQDVTARFDLPGFDNSAMDGYAVRAAELSGDPAASWPVALASRAGGPAPEALPAGHVARIFTGAPMPAGADTVVVQEDTVVAQEAAGSAPARVRFEALPRAVGQHVRQRGSDLQAGGPALSSGVELGPGEVSLLAAQGCAQVLVHRRPKVAILCTGDELVDVTRAGTPGTVVDSNAYALAVQVRQAGADPVVLSTAPDERDAVVAAIRTGLAQADALVTVGGVSVGDYDVVADALAACGATQRFWKVAIKPGKPVRYASAGNKPIFGLPGNPVSAVVTFELFVRPALRRLAGDARPFRMPLPVRLEAARRHGHGRTELLRVSLRAGSDGLLASPLVNQGSGALPSLTGLDALAMLPPGPAEYPGGATVWALPLSGRGAEDSPAKLLLGQRTSVRGH